MEDLHIYYRQTIIINPIKAVLLPALATAAVTLFGSCGETVSASDLPIKVASGSYYTENPEFELSGAVFNEDDRRLVYSITEKPYSSVVYVECEAVTKDGSTEYYRGTGVMISNDLVLTCAHVVCSSDFSGGIAKNATVYSGLFKSKDDLYALYGPIKVDSIMPLHSYIDSDFNQYYDSFDKDLAVLRLSEPIGQKIGYCKISNSPVTAGMKLKTIGYPGKINDADNFLMYETIGTAKICTEDLVYFDADATEGQSGSPLFDKNNNIIGILSAGSDSYNLGPLLNGEKKAWLNYYLVETNRIYRLYNRSNGEHFYTSNAGEIYTCISNGWSYEGFAWTAPTNGSCVYRLYNPNSKTHFYTLNAKERDNLVKLGYRYEGVSWRSASPNNNPVYRLFNPNARGKQSTHHYTMNAAERDDLVSVGWRYEGIAWYAANDQAAD